jgi:hypothetical protein
MTDARSYTCAICGEANLEPSQWFLVTENHWEDKLKIMEWDSLLACEQGIHVACSASHVQELVVHWMATGSVHYPFAQSESWKTPQQWNRFTKLRSIVNTKSVRTIGELTVHRESMGRVLSENPGSLKSILDALYGVLQQGIPAARDQFGMALGD